MADFGDPEMTARLAALQGKPQLQVDIGEPVMQLDQIGDAALPREGTPPMQIQGLDVAVPPRQHTGMEPSFNESVTRPSMPRQSNNRTGSRPAILRPSTSKPPRY